MPRCDATGPRGRGPGTGRGAGTCEEANVPRDAPRRPGRGKMGRGCGRPRRTRERVNWLYGPMAGRRAGPPVRSADDRADLEDQARCLEAQLKGVRARMNDLPE